MYKVLSIKFKKFFPSRFTLPTSQGFTLWPKVLKANHGFTLWPKVLKANHGFTLIELVVVVGILAILATALITSLNPITQFQKSQDSRRKSDLAQIQKSLESYYNDHARYPASNSNKIYAQNSGGTSTVIDWGDNWSPYMNVLPKDPSSSKNYIYHAPSDGQSYYIFASLDRAAKDPQTCNSGNACTSLSALGIGSTACGGTCDFGVSSPNVSP